MKKLILIVLTILAVYSAKAQETNPAVSTPEEISESVKLAPCEMKNRLEAVKKLFIAVGAKEEDIKIEQFKDISNVVVSKKGKSDETIIVTTKQKRAAGRLIIGRELPSLLIFIAQ